MNSKNFYQVAMTNKTIKAIFVFLMRTAYFLHFWFLFSVSLIFPEKYFKQLAISYSAKIGDVDVSARFTKLADACNYDSGKLNLWVTLFSVVWSQEPTFLINGTSFVYPEFEPPLD